MSLFDERCEKDEIPGTRKIQHIQHMRKIGYRDQGSLLRMNQDWEDSGNGDRPHLVTRAPIIVTAGNDGMRRIHPTRELDRYLEIGAPFIKTGGVWGKANLGTPTRTGHSLKWTRPQAEMTVDFGGHFVNLEILLKNGYVPEDGQIAFPVGMSGFTRSGRNILRDNEIVALLNRPLVYDKADPANQRPIDGQFVNISGQPYWLMNLPDLTGIAEPVIDPTLSLQPDATDGIDTYIQNTAATTNQGTFTLVYVGERDGTTDNYRTLIKFNLSSIPATDAIQSATFSMYITADISNNSRPFRVYRQQRAWVESQATWNIYSTGNNWQTSGGFGANDCEQTFIGERTFSASETINTFVDWSLSGAVVGDLDLGNGWLVKAATESNDAYNFASSDNATAANRPKLEVIYETPAMDPVKYMFYQRMRKL